MMSWTWPMEVAPRDCRRRAARGNLGGGSASAAAVCAEAPNAATAPSHAAVRLLWVPSTQVPRRTMAARTVRRAFLGLCFSAEVTPCPDRSLLESTDLPRASPPQRGRRRRPCSAMCHSTSSMPGSGHRIRRSRCRPTPVSATGPTRSCLRPWSTCALSTRMSPSSTSWFPCLRSRPSMTHRSSRRSWFSAPGVSADSPGTSWARSPCTSSPGPSAPSSSYAPGITTRRARIRSFRIPSRSRGRCRLRPPLRRGRCVRFRGGPVARRRPAPHPCLQRPQSLRGGHRAAQWSRVAGRTRKVPGRRSSAAA